LGLKKVVSQAMTFNSTVHRVISLFLTESTHNIIARVSLDDGFLAASNMVDDPGYKFIARVDSNYDGSYHPMYFQESVVVGIFDFSREAEIIKWVIANLTCEQAMQKNAKYACISHNSYCQNVKRGRTHFGYRCKCSNGFQGNPYLENNCTGYISLLYHIFVFSYF